MRCFANERMESTPGVEHSFDYCDTEEYLPIYRLWGGNEHGIRRHATEDCARSQKYIVGVMAIDVDAPSDQVCRIYRIRLCVCGQLSRPSEVCQSVPHTSMS